jgi:hypothetical protein
MARKQYSAEQAVVNLRQIDVLVGESKSIQQACKEAGKVHDMVEPAIVD